MPKRTTLACVLVLAATALPTAAAQARPIELIETPRTVAPSIQPAPDAGFQCDDAGLGAAGAAVLMGAGAMTFGLTRRRRALAG
jgi:hypothetical protein